MNIRKRMAVSVLLIIAMAFSLISFASCTGDNTETEKTIKVNVKITNARDNIVLADYTASGVEMTDFPSNLTVLAALRKVCEIEQLEIGENDGFVTKIGDYSDENVVGASDTETDETAETVEGEEATEPTTANGFYGWGYTLNGTEGTGANTQTLTDGDTIEYVYGWIAYTD